MLAASHNFVFMQLASTIGAALAYSFRVTSQRAQDLKPSLDNHGEVVERIRMRDPEGAQASMSHLLDIAITDLGLSVPVSRSGPASGERAAHFLDARATNSADTA